MSNLTCKMCKKNIAVLIMNNQTDLCNQCWSIEIFHAKEKICSICLSVPEKLLITPCKHVFCYQCYLTWASYNYKGDHEPTYVPCPYCKTIIVHT